MPNYPSITKEDTVASVFAKFNTGVEKPLMLMHQELMRREDSSLTIGQRELIGAYVSGVNSCDYCAGSHSKVAIMYGIEEGLFESLLEDVDKASIEDEIKPILKFVKKLTLSPTKMTRQDVDAVLDAGWDEEGLYDAMMICCTWNFMNRFVFGLGLETNPGQSMRSAMLLKDGYTKIIDRMGLK